MEKADILIKSLEPVIDMKCAEIKQKKSEKLLTAVFIFVAAILLIIPAVLIFFGFSPIRIFIPIIFTAAVFGAASPLLMNKGAESYEQV